jgi:hypothetical protein
MGDPFVPEADALDQEREVAPAPPAEAERDAPLQYPGRFPFEASDADVLEQNQPVLGADDDWRD